MASEKANPAVSYHDFPHVQETKEVANVGLAAALEQSKPSPWTRAMFKLYGFLFVAFLNSCINGYDGSLMGGINAMETYQRYAPKVCLELRCVYG